MHSDGQGRTVLSFYQVLCLIGFYKGIVTLPTGDGRRCSWAASRPTTTMASKLAKFFCPKIGPQDMLTKPDFMRVSASF
jgi:hypothetical protein